jgi:acetyl esterase
MSDKAVNTQEEAAAAYAAGTLSTEDMMRFARAQDPPGPPDGTLRSVTDDEVAGVPVRIYEQQGTATALVVYYHGGGFTVGSRTLMDNIARGIANASGAVAISVEYRLAPEDPFPAGLDDCEAVTRWAIANSARFGVSPDRIFIAGESAGGNLTAAMTLRFQGDPAAKLAGQILIYPVVADSAAEFTSRTEFAPTPPGGDSGAMTALLDVYTGGPGLDRDPFVSPLNAESHAGLPPALLIVGDRDFLYDEGLAYADRLRAAGVKTEHIVYPGQPHGFMNLTGDMDAADDAFGKIGNWMRTVV